MAETNEDIRQLLTDIRDQLKSTEDRRSKLAQSVQAMMTVVYQS